MCLIFLSTLDHPTYKLIIAANRDEFYNRKTAGADFWADHPQILGGRDLEAGGTWFGTTRSGKVSLLTNYRDLRDLKTNAPSRGHLVSGFLLSDVAPEEFLKNVELKARAYNGFNLLVGSVDELWYFSNYSAGITMLVPGLHGLSNHLLNTPWPKVLHGLERIRPVLNKPLIQPDELFEFLYDDQRAPADELPDTGVGLEREIALSSMFIKTPDYGSRCSTVFLVDKKNHALFSERVYDLKTFDFMTRTFEFDIVKR